MAIRNDLIKAVIIFAVLIVITKYPEQFGKFCSVAFTGLTEIIISKFLGNFNLVG